MCLLIAILSLQVYLLLGWWSRPWLRRRRTGGVSSLFDRTLDWPPDEREKAAHDRACRRAYYVVVLVAIAATPAAYIFQEELPGLFRTLTNDGLILLALYGLNMCLGSLPVAFQAWAEPDDDPPAESPPESAP